MPSEKKRHHFVPATYLRRFANSRGMLAICRKDSPDITSWAVPTEAALRRYYYSQPIPDGTINHNALEDLFAQWETSWPNIAEVLEAREPANAVLGDLLGFIGFQRVRVPAFRDAIEQSLQRPARVILDRLRTEGRLPPPPDAHPDLLDQIEVTVDPHQSIHAMAELLVCLGPTLDRFGYQILHNETAVDLITSDNPVSYFELLANGRMLPYPTRLNGPAELLFPVSSSTIIYGQTVDRRRFSQRGLKHVSISDPERIRRYNRITAQFAYEATISRSALPPVFTRRYAPASPVLDPSFQGFDPNNFQIPPYVFGERRKLLKYQP